MSKNHLKGLIGAAKGVGTEAVDKLLDSSWVSIALAGVKGYREAIEEEQAELFADKLKERENELSNVAWYQTEEGEQFKKKVVATALNAEYADKLEFLANAFVNGPKLSSKAADREKYVELIRHLSKPALEILIVALRNPVPSNEVMVGDLAVKMRWPAALVDSCVKELHSLGVFSAVVVWAQTANSCHPEREFANNAPAITELTRDFAGFISRSKTEKHG